MLSSSLLILYMDCNKFCRDCGFTQGSSFASQENTVVSAVHSLERRFLPCMSSFCQKVLFYISLVSHIPTYTSALCFSPDIGLLFCSPSLPFCLQYRNISLHQLLFIQFMHAFNAEMYERIAEMYERIAQRTRGAQTDQNVISFLPSSYLPFPYCPLLQYPSILRSWFSPGGGGTILKRWDFGPSCLFACLLYLFIHLFIYLFIYLLKWSTRCLMQVLF